MRSGHIHVDGLIVEAADLRGRLERLHGFSVDAMQGAFTLWNQQPDPAIKITADLLDVAAGRADRPVRGSGVFVGGHSDWNGAADGGTVRVTTLRTGEIHAKGAGSDGVHVRGDGPDLSDVKVTAANGKAIVRDTQG